MKITHVFAILLATTGLGSLSISAPAADTYPSRPIRVIIPNGPASSVDTLTRIVGNKLTEVLGQQIVMDNRGGASGVIGMEIAKLANRDGYTVITTTSAASTISPLLLKNPPFHPLDDFDMVGQFAVTLSVLVVANSLPVKSVAELIAYANNGKQPFNMASAGVGSQSHLAGAYFVQETRIPSLHVPYKGGGPATASLITGESQWSFIPAPAALRHVAAKRVRAIGHSLNRRTDLLPGIAPIAEALPGFDYTGWMGFSVPRGTPKAVIDRLEAAVAKAMMAPEVKKAMAFEATEIVVLGPADFRKVVADSMIKNARLIKTVGLKSN